MNRRIIWAAAVSAVVITVLLMYVFFKPGKEQETETEKEAPAVVSYLSEKNQREVVLFFQRMGSDSLVPEYRKIMKTATVSSQAKQVLASLIEGSREGLVPVLPATVMVKELLISPEGTAYVDFSHHIRTDSAGGTCDELMMISAVNESIIRNFPEISSVRILIEGEETETITGHISLSSPFIPRIAVEKRDPEPVFSSDNIPLPVPDVQNSAE